MTVEEYFDTDFIQIAGKRYCPYCGKEIPVKDGIEDHDIVYYWKCDCEDALKAHDIRLQIERLKYTLPQPKYKVASKIVPYEE